MLQDHMPMLKRFGKSLAGNRKPRRARSLPRHLQIESLEGRQMMSYLPAPVLGVPLSGSTGQSTTPAFSWSPVNGASSYRIMVATNPGDLPTNPTASTGGPSVLINDTPAGDSDRPSISLAPGRTYYWEVHARSASQYGLWSNEGSFTTAPANLPAPTLSSPGNGAAGVSTKPVFSWSQVSGNYGYRIIVATNPNDLPTDPNQSSSGSGTVLNLTVGQNTTSYTWGGALNAGTTYYWEVHALGSTAGGLWSSKGRFSTVAAPIISSISPNPLIGSNTAQTLTINGSGFASGMQIRLQTVGVNMTEPALFLSSTRLQISAVFGNDPTTWSVQVVNANGSTVGAPTSFSVNAPVPTITSLSSTTASAGTAAFTLTVSGSTFSHASVVRWNGTNQPTTPIVSSGGLVTGLKASISAADIASAGTAQVTVYSPGPSGGVSSPVTFTITSNLVLTPGQQFTWGQEGGFIAVPYHPSPDSGVTIGVGYDMSQRSAAGIVSDLAAAGVNMNTAAKLSQAAGLTGTAADTFVRNNGTLTITPAQGNALFLAVYASEAQYTQSIANSPAVVQLYGVTNWSALNQKITDILIDMIYRGDYTVSTRTLIQKYVVANDLADFTTAMSIRTHWSNVPLTRFNARVAYLRG